MDDPTVDGVHVGWMVLDPCPNTHCMPIGQHSDWERIHYVLHGCFLVNTVSNMELAFDGVNIVNGLYRSGALHIY